MNHMAAILLVILALCSACHTVDAVYGEGEASVGSALDDARVSPTWQKYVDQKQQGLVTDLPDYSWAGYERGERSIPEVDATADRFVVTDFGAHPDDLLDDRRGIQSAIDAAEANGGGVVYLPAGRYLINTQMADRGTLTIEADHVILKGAGSRASGTIIHQIHPFGGGNPHDFRRMHLGDNLLLIHAGREEKRLSERRVLCKITGDSDRETFDVEVDHTQQLSVGDHVYLYARNKAVIEKAIAPFVLEEAWTSTTQNKSYTVEIHEIAAINDNRVTFAEPIRYDIKAEHQWELRERAPLSHVGVEDIAFMGNGWHPYKHHRSGMDDGGWSMIKIKGVTDSYVRRCSFIHCSQSVYVAQSSYVSLLNITQAGNPGHHSPRVVFHSYGVLGGLINDQAGCTHGPSLQGGALGTVFWRWKGVDGSIDSHAGKPYTSLYDNVCVNRISSSGGRRSYPQHLRNLMLWNVNLQADQPRHYDFWQPEKSNVFMMPMVVGMHGSEVTFNEEHLALLESHGQPVLPESLYESQLALRLGEMPDWIRDVQEQQEALDAQALPAYYDRRDPQSPTWFYPETFYVYRMLDYLTHLSLQAYDSKLFTFTMNDDQLILNTDQSFVRHAVYALMHAIYQQTQHANTIHAEAMTTTGVNGIRLALASGPVNRTMPDMDADPYVTDARAIVERIGGRIVTEYAGKSVRFVVEVPDQPAR